MHLQGACPCRAKRCARPSEQAVCPAAGNQPKPLKGSPRLSVAGIARSREPSGFGPKKATPRGRDTGYQPVSLPLGAPSGGLPLQGKALRAEQPALRAARPYLSPHQKKAGRLLSSCFLLVHLQGLEPGTH